LTVPVKLAVIVVAIGFGLALPAMGVSLIVFLLIDLMRSAFHEMANAEREHGLPPGLR
jgi:uncharacterized iron-regulated membrane protein